MRVLVTGAAGFIGSHVAEALLKQGNEVVGIDNLNDYYSPETKQRNLESVTQSSWRKDAFHFVQGDVRDRELINGLFNDNQFEAVAHLAAMAGVRASLDDPVLYIDVNLVGTVNLLEAAKSLPHPPNFVFASTSSVYGATKQVPFLETDLCDHPLAPYPASKRAGEMMGYTYHHIYGLDFTAVRFFTVYGPRGRPDMMAFKVADNIIKGKAVSLYNGGQMYRDWTYVGDIAQGVVAAIDRRLGYEVINLGRGEPVLLLDFVQIIERQLGNQSEMNSEPMPAADIPYTFADISKARQLLGYEPKVSVEQGIASFLEWYQFEQIGGAVRG